MTDAPEVPPARKAKRAHSRAEFEATVADIEAQVRATNARIEAQVRATNAKIEERTGRNLVAAVVIGIVFGAAFLFSLIVIKEIFMAFAAVLLVFVTLELATALRTAGRNVPRVASAIAAAVMVPAAFYSGEAQWLHGGGQWIVGLGGMLFVTLWRIAEQVAPSRRTTSRALGLDILGGLFIQAYAVFLGSFTAELTGEPDGQLWTLALLIVVISTDTGAYASGLLLGRHKMAPRISPKKTWEGFAGSILAALIAGVLVALFLIHVPVWVGLIFGIALALTATLGDLTESLIKRDLGIKDISNWLPGHGGFLDRLDSVLPSAAVAFALYLLFHGAR
ncbi:MAG: phosphatidate cytidylyltransferase [Glaciihabitans sp.]|jgi:phosphatidate cytidylyltransferase|nr:phosphatidate cytidylyltransferase [Glaciihabitans sp.]